MKRLRISPPKSSYTKKFIKATNKNLSVRSPSIKYIPGVKKK